MLLAHACGGQAAPPPAPTLEPRLPTLAELLQRAFPGLALVSLPGQGLSLAADPRWHLAPLPPPLQGQPWGLLAFFALEGPEGLAPGLGLPSGTYAVASDASTYALSADGARLLPVQRLGGGAPPPTAPPGPVRPLLALDADADGRHEIALAWQEEGGAASYRLYWRQGEGWAQDDERSTPAQAALDYWAAIATALARAQAWTPLQRQRLAWPWLAVEEGEAASYRLLAALAEETGRHPDQEQQALEGVRAAFRQAWQVFSPQFQQRQTWPGFITAFRYTEAAQLEAMSPPRPLDDERAQLQVVVSLQLREGEEVVWRRFQVTLRLRQGPQGRWLLDDVDAQEVG